MTADVLNNTRMGIRDGMPIGIGYFAISFAFGIMAVSYGLTVPEAIMISALNLTSAGQLASLPIISAGGSLIELALAQLLINLRYSLMSISLSQKLDSRIKPADRFYLALTLTDEMFAVSVGKPQQLGRKYLLSLLLLPYLGWTLGTAAGALAGQLLPQIIVTSLGVSMYAMFIAIIVPAAKHQMPIAICIVISILLSLAFNYLPYLKSVPDGFVIIISAIIASVVLAILFPIEPESEDSVSESEAV